MANELNYTARLSITEAKKSALELQKIFKEVGISPASNDNYKTSQLALQDALRRSRLELQELKKAEQELKNTRAQTIADNAELTRKINENRLAQQQLNQAAREARANQTAAAGSYKEAQQQLTALGKSIREAAGGFNSMNPAVRAQVAEYAALNNRLKEFDSALGNNQRNVGNYKSALSGVGNELKSMALNYVSAFAVLAGVRSIIATNAEISDSLAAVRRTAGLTAEEVNLLAESLKKIDTRTSLKGLLEIATIGGQLGIAKDQLAGFTKAVDQLSVALGSELKGGAEGIAKSLGVLDNVFKITASNGGDVEKSLNQIGSTILGLGQSGLATGDFLADFGERVGGIAKQVGLSLPVVLAYGAALEENGVSAEVAGTSFKRLISALSVNSEGFFKIAKIADANLSLKEFKNLINTDVKGALDLFFNGLKKGGTTTTEFMSILKGLKLSQSGVSQVVAALSNSQESLNGHIKDAENDFGNATIASEQFKLANDTLAGSLDKLGNTLTNITTNPDSNLGSWFKGLVNAFTGGLKALDIGIDNFRKSKYDAAIRNVNDPNQTGTGNFFISVDDVKAEKNKRALDKANQDKKDALKIGSQIARDAVQDIKAEGTSINVLAREYKKLNELRGLYGKSGKNNNQVALDLIAQKQAVALLNAEYKKAPKSVPGGGGGGETEDKKAKAAREKAEREAKKQQEADLKEATKFYNDLLKVEEDYYRSTLTTREREEFDLGKKYTDLLAREKNTADDVIKIKAAQKLEEKQLDEKYAADFDKAEKERYAAAFEAALTHEQAVARINKDYTDKAIALRSKLGKDATVEQKRELDAQIGVLNGKWQVELEGEKQNAFQKTEIYRKLNNETLELTRSRIIEEIKALQALVDSGVLTGKLKTKIEAQLSSLKGVLSIGVDETNLKNLEERIALIVAALSNPDALSKEQIVAYNKELAETQQRIDNIKKSDFLKGLEENFAYLKKGAGTKEFFEGLSSDLGQISGSFGELSNALGGVNTEAGYTLDTIGQLVGVASDAAGAAASFASGDIIGGVTKTIKAISGIFSIGKKVKEMNAAARKEVEDFYANAIAGEKAYQDKLRERELQTIRQNKLVLQGIRDEIALRKEQTSDYAKETAEIMAKLQGQSYVSAETYTHGTWFRKAKVDKTYTSLAGKSFEELSSLLAQGKLEADAKALVERLIELEQKGYDASLALDELAKERDIVFTGTTADAIAGGIINGFKAGKKTAADFADDFGGLMEDALLSAFKSQYLDGAIDDFYKEFAKVSADGLDDAEIEALRARYAAVIASGSGLADAIKKIRGEVVEGLDEGFKTNAFSLLLQSAEETGKSIEQILKDSILDGLKAQIFTDALKPLQAKISALYKDGNIPTKEELAAITAEYTAFINGAKAKLKEVEDATGLVFGEKISEDLSAAAEKIKSEIQSISDSILDVFANSDNALQDFESKFNGMVKNTILKSLQETTLQGRLTEFYTEFQKLSTVSDGEKEAQVAKLRAQYNAIIKEGKDEYERLQGVFGVDYGSSASKPSAAIGEGVQRITEDTANAIAGPIIGTFEQATKIANLMGKHYAIATQALDMAVKTEANTRRTANNTDGLDAKLDAIERNTRPKTGSSLSDSYSKI